jgi:hypothetical protein
MAAMAVSVERRMRWKCAISAGSNSICCARIEIADMPSSAIESSSPIFSINAISSAPLTAVGILPAPRSVQMAPTGSPSTSIG